MARGKVTTRSNVAVLKQTYCKQSIRLLSQNYIYISLLYKSHSHFSAFFSIPYLSFCFVFIMTLTHKDTPNWRSFQRLLCAVGCHKFYSHMFACREYNPRKYSHSFDVNTWQLCSCPHDWFVFLVYCA